jgi:hypothetical protein
VMGCCARALAENARAALLPKTMKTRDTTFFIGFVSILF